MDLPEPHSTVIPRAIRFALVIRFFLTPVISCACMVHLDANLLLNQINYTSHLMSLVTISEVVPTQAPHCKIFYCKSVLLCAIPVRFTIRGLTQGMSRLGAPAGCHCAGAGRGGLFWTVLLGQNVNLKPLFSPINITNITNEIHRTRSSCLLQQISVQEFPIPISSLFLSNLMTSLHGIGISAQAWLCLQRHRTFPKTPRKA